MIAYIIIHISKDTANVQIAILTKSEYHVLSASSSDKIIYFLLKVILFSIWPDKNEWPVNQLLPANRLL